MESREEINRETAGRARAEGRSILPVEQKGEALLGRLRSRYERMSQGAAIIDPVVYWGAACNTIRALADEGLIAVSAADAIEASIMDYLFKTTDGQ